MEIYSNVCIVEKIDYGFMLSNKRNNIMGKFILIYKTI